MVSRAFLGIWRLSNSPTGSSSSGFQTAWFLHHSQNDKTDSQIEEILSKKCTSGVWDHAPKYLLLRIPQPRPLYLSNLPTKGKNPVVFLIYRWTFSSYVIQVLESKHSSKWGIARAISFSLTLHRWKIDNDVQDN